ncbi:hypothetical protein OIV83_001666 [Microbotryomycetes sp. JL201]|nr:hypothetical protein OIV83_001666 [Microbotryomycetes sp. JL201]
MAAARQQNAPVDGFMAVPGQEIAPTGLTPTIRPGFADADEQLPSLQSLLLDTASALADSLKKQPPQPRQLVNVSAKASSAPTPTKQSTATTILSPALIGNPRALLSNPKSQEYLASLLCMPLPTLQQLPNSLATLSRTLDNDLSSLAFTRYSSFLLAHSASQAMSTSFTTLSNSLEGFIESTDALKSVVSSFEQTVSEPRRKRERMSLVRERMEEVEELLEAPSVVDACVRAGYWSEAIDVALRLSDLHRRMSKGAAGAANEHGKGALLLLERVKDQIGVALLSLRARVLESLAQRGLKLPGAVRGVAILRRIGERRLLGALVDGAGAASIPTRELDEDGLRIVFLAARWNCLKGELATVEAQMTASGIKLAEGSSARYNQPDESSIVEENEERTRWTKRWIEVWREIIGETVGMYTELFLSSTTLFDAAAKPNDRQTLPPTAPLALFLTTALTKLADIFAVVVPSLASTASLSSLLTQLSYCSQSFARFGLDFREIQQLRERVEVRVGRIVVTEWEQAGRKWEKEWRDGWEGGAKGTTAAAARRIQLLGGRAPISDWLVVPEGLSQVASTPLPERADPSEQYSAKWHHQPPPTLALLPPLARFLNAHATALNSLRLLPPISVYPQLLVSQARELDRATQVLAAFADAWLSSSAAHPVSPHPDGDLSQEERMLQQIRDDERQLITFAIMAFGRWVVPWCEGALKVGVYGQVTSDETSVRLLGLRTDREHGLVKALRRVEMLVARIEGRNEVEEVHPETRAEEPTINGGAETQERGPGERADGSDGRMVQGGEAAGNIASTEAPSVDVDAPIEDLPVDDMPLVDPPAELMPEVRQTVHEPAPAVEVEVEPAADEEEVDEGWGISGDVGEEEERE